MSLFDTRDIRPMLIGESGEAFNSPDFIFELKLDGERCLAYMDDVGADFRNKRNMKMNAKIPELAEVYRQVDGPCILDGELIVLKEGELSFFEIQRRSLMSKSFRIELAAAKTPASFIAFDILYCKGRELMGLPLMERKRILKDIIRENARLAVSRYIEEQGRPFYDLAEERDLEGIVAKRKDSKYFIGKRTKDWIKIKNLQDDDFVVCGYLYKEGFVANLVLGQYQDGCLIYKGHVTLGVSSDDMRYIKQVKTIPEPLFDKKPPGHKEAVWLTPELVCTVKYMMKHAGGSLRQPVFKGLRPDKEPEDCVSS